MKDSLMDCLREIGWRTPVAGFPSAGWRGGLQSTVASASLPSEWRTIPSTTVFMQFFESGLLDDEVINMMLHWIDRRAQSMTSPARGAIIANLTFTRALVLNYDDQSKAGGKLAPALELAKQEVNVLGRATLFFVLNSSGNHWATVKVDFAQRTYAYGDSLSLTRCLDKRVVGALVYWLNSTFNDGKPFSAAPNLPCEQQQDGISCGITAVTMISSALGIDEPWKPSEAILNRYKWALRIVQTHQTCSMMNSADSYNVTEVPEPSSVLASPTTRSAGLPTTTRLARSNPMALDSILQTTNDAPFDSTALQYQKLKPLHEDEEMVILVDNKCGTNLDGEHCNSIVIAESASPKNLTGPRLDANGVLHFTDSEDESQPHINSEPVAKPQALARANLGKHKRSDSTADPDHITGTAARKKSYAQHELSTTVEMPKDQNSGPVGISKSAIAERKKRQEIKDGTFIVNNRAVRKMMDRVHEKYDPDAIVDPNDPTCTTLIHSVCKRSIRLDSPNHTSKFSAHVNTCLENGGLRKNGKFTQASKGCQKISSFFQPVNKSKDRSAEALALSEAVDAELLMDQRHLSASPPPSPKSTFCCGLRVEHDNRIQNLAERGAIGGRVSHGRLALEEFDTEFGYLDEEQKLQVLTGATATARWICFYTPTIHIQSTKCTKTCNPDLAEVKSGPTNICNPCADLLHLTPFQSALAKPVAKLENLKYVPKGSQNKLLGDLCKRYTGLGDLLTNLENNTMSPLMKLAIKTSKGEIKTPKMFLGLVEAMVLQEDKIVRGKGMQGIRYPPSWTDFCKAAYVNCPRAYKLLKDNGLPVVGERSLRQQRSQMPKFPIGISDRTFERASEYLSTLGYHGPVGLSCDDTQLCSKLTPYYDAEQRKWFIIGSIGDPIEVDGDTEDIEEVVKKAGQCERATKLRLWCLQVAVPKVPVFILAAMAIGPGLKADDLLGYHKKLVDGLLTAGICIVSYACDGSATERKVTSEFVKSAPRHKKLVIPHALAGFAPYTVTIPLYGPNEVPIISIQDPKHAAKTVRNNSINGSRSLTAGNRIICYQQIRELASDQRSPLYWRDVDRIDRQDDRAAMRFLSSEMLNHVHIVNDERKASSSPNLAAGKDLDGLSAYLFIFGELIDAFQNRSLPIAERCKMVLRAWYFLDIWRSCLRTLNYSEATHFISREAYDIIGSLIQGFLGLVVVHRDHLDGNSYPYIPWLHSTEACEHTFGEARKLRPDFTMGDFVYMQPKLAIVTEGILEHSDLDHVADAKARAAGYFNTVYSSKGIDLAALVSYPTDTVIHEMAKQAFYEAEAVFNTCDIPTHCFYRPPEPVQLRLPPIANLLSTDEDDDDLGADNLVCASADSPSSLTEQFERVLQAGESQDFTTVEFSDKMDAFAVAAVALHIEQQNEIDCMPNCDTFKYWEEIRRNATKEHPRFPLPPLLIADKIRHAMSQVEQVDIDKSQMISLRRAHETHFAKKAVRIGSSLTPVPSATTVSDEGSVPENANKVHQSMIKRMHEVLREYENTIGASTGAARRARYGGAPAKPLVGNAMNANIVASGRMKASMQFRGSVASKKKLRCTELVVNAGVTSFAPLEAGCFAIVLVDKQLWLAEVITLYSKGAGKGGAYGWTQSANCIAGITCAVVQLWEHWNAGEFNSIVRATAGYRASRFAHISWSTILYVASGSSISRLSPERLKVNASLLGSWRKIAAEQGLVEQLVGEVSRWKQPLVEGEDAA